ncbi:hypothetical protein ACFVJ4_34165 [Streptomyces sp. NPDC127178]
MPGDERPDLGGVAGKGTGAVAGTGGDGVTSALSALFPARVDAGSSDEVP